MIKLMLLLAFWFAPDATANRCETIGNMQTGETSKVCRLVSMERRIERVEERRANRANRR